MANTMAALEILPAQAFHVEQSAAKSTFNWSASTPPSTLTKEGGAMILVTRGARPIDPGVIGAVVIYGLFG